MVKKDCKVTGRIMIQDGQHSHIRRFAGRNMEFDGPFDEKAELRVMSAFADEIKDDMNQTQLPTEKPDAGPKKITEPKGKGKDKE